MRIRNEYTRTPVFWRTFPDWDSTFGIGNGEGVKPPGQNIGPFSGGAFKLELKENSLWGEFLSSAGAIYRSGDNYVLTADGWLVADPPPQVPTGPTAREKKVRDFDIAVYGFAFKNDFPATSLPVQDIAGFRITNNTYGLCGGMAYLAADHFVERKPVPSQSNIPIGGPLFDRLWARLIDSFNLPFGSGSPGRYLVMQSKALADAGPPTVLGVRSRADVMINVEWPRIRNEIDNERVCPLALIYQKTSDPGLIFKQHQVLAFGYEVRGSWITLLIYDPNEARAEQRLSLDTANINRHSLVYTTHNGPGEKVWAFFATDYVPKPVPGNIRSEPSWDSGWRSLGRNIAGPPELVSMNPTHLAVFGTWNSQLFWMETDGSAWSAWTSLGGVINSPPGGTSWGNGRMDLFARGADGSLQHIWRDGSAWGSWEGLGGQIVGGPDACSWGPGRLDVFARGTDNTLQHIWYDGGWQAWESLGGALTSDPTAVSWGDGRIDVFARGTDLRLYHTFFASGGWSDWEPLGGGGVLASGPDVASWGPERLDVFVRGQDGALHTLVFDGGWKPWQALGGVIVSDPSAVALEPNRIAVVATGADLGLWIKNYS